MQHYPRHLGSSWVGDSAKTLAHQNRSTLLSAGLAPNTLWCTDYKGEFLLGDKRYCYPLTVSDHASLYLLLCEAMESVREQGAFTAFERLFKERGLPQAIRSDNGIPLWHQAGFRLYWRLISGCANQSAGSSFRRKSEI
ncbi:MAG TPA: hypothetical protein VJT08_04615 [Terriglobales bacterium]|nr:hypothetical protein [Terriglobales bacterium]